ncbi:hypothetical protein RO3G_16364 [Rhizopus delemar RA 99-880]|uniref:Uncharacterized protein n=1 Tax=Rhizopus delemar (strain RA 99-880 / ATCC MYA-4621 / FGSC 9543 / NRRL 43880) TaxID=246409 RepID=I1CT73_RHIO9|nr:hypothetical protein RO3G_16364 [Rhizopus delemar RA 99-880]|eukprot:EIE91653.1 hypothetical protein RO3G_16364 [Rhizopus delemar RA 99-880]
MVYLSDINTHILLQWHKLPLFPHIEPPFLLIIS